MDIYTIANTYGIPYLCKNFEQVTGTYRVDLMQIENGDLYYTNSGSEREIRKNDNKVADYTNQPVSMSVVNGTIYLVTFIHNVSPYTYHLHKINPDGTSKEIDIPLAATTASREFYKVVANAAGEVYILGKETDFFNETEIKLWKISSSEEVSETVFAAATHNYSVRDITTDSNGDAWVVLGNRSNYNECYLYKNGVNQTTIATNGLSNFDTSYLIAIRFNGSDRYIAYSTGTGITVLKNNSVLYSIATDNKYVYVEDMEISSKGDIYLLGSGCIYKNNTLLHSQYALEIEIME